jgi:hypothetical protein
MSPLKVRLCLLAFLLGSAIAPAQPSGTYQPANGPGVPWNLNENHTLIWGGQPYLPVGLRIEGTVASISAAKAAGVSDVIVELPASGSNWKEAFAALEAAQMRYIVAIDSLAPMARGYAVEPAGYRINGIFGEKVVSVKLPGALSAYSVLVLRRDGSVIKTFRPPIENGLLQLKLQAGNELEHALLIYPEMRSLQQPDFWDALDEHRDSLLTAIKRNPPGPGFRGMLNPMGALVNLPSSSAKFVPTSSYFRFELRQFLENKYKNVNTAMRSWSMSVSGIDSFEELARCVPLWSGTRGLPLLWDPVQDQTAIVESKRSAAWNDIGEVIAMTTAKRYQRLASAVRALVDVPVVQEWAGWNPIYEGDEPPVDGVAYRTDGATPNLLLESASRAISTVSRWRKPGWLLSSSIELPDAGSLGPVLTDLTSVGARGWFVANAAPDLVKAVAAASGLRDGSPATYRPIPVYFPENALNPAMPQGLGGNRWWLPTPYAGDRLDFGSRLFAYRMRGTNDNYVALWTAGEARRIKIKVAAPKSFTFRTVDGTDPDVKQTKQGIEVTVTSTPLLISGPDEIPVPVEAQVEVNDKFMRLMSVAEDRKANTSEEAFLFRDALASFNTNPGGSYATMRLQFLKLLYKLANYSWIEAEISRPNTFSEVTPVPGCSGGNVLSLTTEIGSEVQTYEVSYNVAVRTTVEQEVWIAARIPAERRGDLKVNIGGQLMGISGEPVSLYGLGYGWYRLGTTRLAGSMVQLKIDISSPRGADLALDTIVLYPGNFRPNGVSMPQPFDWANIKLKKK